MNISLQKYAPPVAVIGIALYLGWPPAAPMDLGEDVVRAKSVRWKVEDLKTPLLPTVISGDPFAAVLVESSGTESGSSNIQSESTIAEPSGPTVEELQHGLKLGGIAQTDRYRWAIVNSRVCKIGDRVPVIGFENVTAEIDEISPDYVTVRWGQLTVRLKQEDRKKRSPTTPAVTADQATADLPSQGSDEEDDQEENQPNNNGPDNSDPDRQRSGNDPREQFFQVTP